MLWQAFIICVFLVSAWMTMGSLGSLAGVDSFEIFIAVVVGLFLGVLGLLWTVPIIISWMEIKPT